MTRAITLAALTCFLLAGAAITAILGRDSLPAAQADVGPVANRTSKQDKLAVTTLVAASFDVPAGPAVTPADPSPLLLRARADVRGSSRGVPQPRPAPMCRCASGVRWPFAVPCYTAS